MASYGHTTVADFVNRTFCKPSSIY